MKYDQYISFLIDSPTLNRLEVLKNLSGRSRGRVIRILLNMALSDIERKLSEEVGRDSGGEAAPLVITLYPKEVQVEKIETQ